jgi:hypothetical protein
MRDQGQEENELRMDHLEGRQRRGAGSVQKRIQNDLSKRVVVAGVVKCASFAGKIIFTQFFKAGKDRRRARKLVSVSAGVA